MAAVGLSVASTAGLVALFASGKSATAGSDSASSAAVVRAATITPSTTVTPSTSSPRVAAEDSTTASSTTAPSTVSDATSVVDGAVYNNRWGDVQVEATFDANGALIDIVALKTPDDRDKSVRINDRAIPELTTEALAAQSASIDSVSGATYTSNDYSRSLQSAIDAARTAGVTTIA